MRLLLTSDLHLDGRKLLWLLDRVPPCDAVLVAGDLLSMASRQSFALQAAGVLRWRDAIMRTGRDFCWCSGNHDVRHGPLCGSAVDWMRNARSMDRFVGDGETGLIAESRGGIAVTSIPWPFPHPLPVDETSLRCHRGAYLALVSRLVEEAHRIKTERGVPWIALLHQPPGETPLAAGTTLSRNNSARRTLEWIQPDFSLHGHIHRAPLEKNGSWICPVGETICFNAGQSAPSEQPHFILLEWHGPGDWTATWSGAGRVLTAGPRPSSP
jgi:Icc-related predicted phosphoesterase